MEYLVNSRQMKQCDAYTIQNLGVPSMVLMERAALAAVEVLYAREFDLNKVLIVCGTGNNGGDGLAIARLLYLRGLDPHIYMIGNKDKCSEETKQQKKIIENYGLLIRDQIEISEYNTIVDAIFGIGIDREVSGSYYDVITEINQAKARVAAVDIPSGISADTGRVMGIAVKADVTVTFAFNKLGNVLYPGTEYAGDVIVKDIGIDMHGFDGRIPSVYSYKKSDLQILPERKAYSNKGTYGKVLVIAGSINMSGAAYLCAKAAYRTGAGLVRIFTPEENRCIIQSQLPEAIVSTYNVNNFDEEPLVKALEWADAVAAGPGLGTDDTALRILKTVLEHVHTAAVIDADGLNILAENRDLLKKHTFPLVVTPHVAEMARLTGKDVSAVGRELIEEAVRFAEDTNVICVLKDARTIVTKGRESVYINQSGCHAMATGGSGDVLTGIIASLIAQNIYPHTAAAIGVYLHGLAGESAMNALGGPGVMAGDIAEHAAAIMQQEERERITNEKLQ